MTNFEDQSTGARMNSRLQIITREREERGRQFQKLDDDNFNLYKFLTTLGATVFGSSIALASNKQVNILFFIGELFLFLGVSIGIILVWFTLKQREHGELSFSGMQLGADLRINKDIIGEFENKLITIEMQEYKRRADAFESHVYWKILDRIWSYSLQPITIILLLFGLLLIVLSLRLVPANGVSMIEQLRLIP